MAPEEKMPALQGTNTWRTKGHLKVLETVLLSCEDPDKAQNKGEDPGAHILWLQHIGQELYQAGMVL